MEMKPIPKYEGLYSATDDGQIYSERSKKFLKPRLDKGGYQQVNLHKNGVQKTYKVHRLIAMTFLKNPDNLPCVNHKDENRINNCIDNLEFCTHEYNNQYGSHSRAVYCLEINKTFLSIKAVARELNISSGSLSATLKRHNGKCIYSRLHFEYVEK